MPLTVENMYQWMNEKRPYNLSEDHEWRRFGDERSGGQVHLA